MKFEPLTLVPFDLEGIDPGQMEAGERKLLNQYHALVYEKISPYLNEEEQSWLKKPHRKYNPEFTLIFPSDRYHKKRKTISGIRINPTREVLSAYENRK